MSLSLNQAEADFNECSSLDGLSATTWAHMGGVLEFAQQCDTDTKLF